MFIEGITAFAGCLDEGAGLAFYKVFFDFYISGIFEFGQM